MVGGPTPEDDFAIGPANLRKRLGCLAGNRKRRFVGKRGDRFAKAARRKPWIDGKAKFPYQLDQPRQWIRIDDLDTVGVQPCNDVGSLGDGCPGAETQLDGLWAGSVGHLR